MLESKIERDACRKIYQMFGITNVKFTPTKSTGYPDRILWVPGGKPLFIEFKRPGEDLKPKQKYIAKELRKLGYNVVACDSVFSAVASVYKILHKRKKIA